MLEILELCKRVAPSKATLLIQGESGTGKELFARFVHRHSQRNQGLYVAVNCASLPESLLESELFGHEKGAFTGAVCKKIGKFELAHRGTILLDEISEMNTLLQAKILRVLQENEVDRIGGRQPIPVDIRVIATTNRNLEACIEKGEFREDLYYRLNVISMKLPPLRERTDDIELLTQYFLKQFSETHGKPMHSISENALSWLRKQEWRGNVRELRNTIERAVLISPGQVLTLQDFGSERLVNSEENLAEDSPTLSLRNMEKKLIFRALEKTNGNRTHAAKILGISIRTLRNKLSEYKQGLSPQEAL
jgi:two-component system response regulator FlrC